MHVIKWYNKNEIPDNDLCLTISSDQQMSPMFKHKEVERGKKSGTICSLLALWKI